MTSHCFTRSAPNMDFVIEWQGYRIQVAYQPNWLGGASQFAVSHLDITTIDPPRAPLPITETGYRSHFLHPDVVAAQGGPETFVKAWLDAKAHDVEWQTVHAANQQLDLFGGG
jgi:hypothetical protein